MFDDIKLNEHCREDLDNFLNTFDLEKEKDWILGNDHLLVDYPRIKDLEPRSLTDDELEEILEKTNSGIWGSKPHEVLNF